MAKIPKNHQSDQNISKPLKWPQYHWNIQNDKNKPKTYQITKLPLKPPKQQKYPKMTKMTKTLSETPKWPKYLGGRVSIYLVILEAKCHFSKSDIESVISSYFRGVNVYHFFLLFSFIHKSNTKKFSICFLFWHKAIPNIQPP